ncbi:Abi-alpha family protein [Antrihabitans sp. YC2-6]|uniref:Abi-alpha family protein n=1 Tax=Antrihabitans sp. YC2-6 TaxID=2799498 RepID=UPI0018F60B83|nr:Abi-alpha family protein [Antrihabitans sp. YC2-6]MBJ8347973.1 DUF4393 domain-containing protein [Antrihabitans sp. YC2-6]
MAQEKSGPHELRPLPVVTATRSLAGALESASRRLRHLPIDGLAFAGRMTPIGLIRRPIALTESVLRDVLLSDERSSTASSLYPGAAERDDETFTAPPDPTMSVRSMLHELLERSVRQSPRQAAEANFKRLLLQLVPDEVRILNALSDGRVSPLINVGVGPPGGVERHVLDYATTIGTEAGVRRPDAVTSYVSHLEALGLVDIGPEDETLREQYEILETYEEIEKADETAKAKIGMGAKLTFRSPKHVKHTLTISDLGQELWTAADPDTYQFQVPEQRERPKPTS